jgi:NADH-quinone oxidoreductase subunit J
MNFDPSTLFAVFFYAFAGLLVIAALRVVTVPNPVHAALFLVLAFFSASGIWMLLKAEFLSLILILVYVGAVMVLFLFVVMMLDINLLKLREGFWSHLPMGALVAFLLVSEMALILSGSYFDLLAMPKPDAAPVGYSNTKELGRLLYTDYVYPFELAAVILLVAIVAAIALTLRRRKHAKSIDPAWQAGVRKEDRVRVVTMPSEVEQPSALVTTEAEQKTAEVRP